MKTFAIIGLGQIGLTYDLDAENNFITDQTMSHFQAILRTPNCGITYVIDPREEILHAASKLTACQTFKSILEISESPSPKIVIISTPTDSHLDVTKHVLKSWKPELLIIEKPAGETSKQCHEMMALSISRNIPVVVNYFRRSLPNFRDVKETKLFVNRGRLLKVTIKGYGSLINIYSHFFDLLIFFEGQEILGITNKVMNTQKNAAYNFEDPETGIVFFLIGVGSAKSEIEMILEYENLEIAICSSGQIIELRFPNTHDAICAYNSPKEYRNYQYEVTKKLDIPSEIGTFSKLSDALRIHQFVESIELPI